MRATFSVTASCTIAAALSGCAETSGIREHDAMLDALARGDRERLTGDTVAVGGAALDRPALVTAVLARNPELDVARETWRAAAAAYPGAAALADPMVSYAVAPFSVGAQAPFGQTIELRQKLPWPGKRRLAGDAALADAQAAAAELAGVRLELAEATIDAFDDDYVAARALEVNLHHRELLERIEKSAIAQYTVGRGSQQDPLEARAEIIALDRERLMLETPPRAAIARINSRSLHPPAQRRRATPCAWDPRVSPRSRWNRWTWPRARRALPRWPRDAARQAQTEVTTWRTTRARCIPRFARRFRERARSAR